MISISRSELALGNPQPALTAAEQVLERAMAHGITDRTEAGFEHASNAHEALGNQERAAALRHQAEEL